MNIHLISESMDIDETVEFMVDTGASRTTLLDKDAIYLDLDYDKLPKYKEELIRTLRIPSLLGRDVINKFRLIFDKEKEELTLE